MNTSFGGGEIGPMGTRNDNRSLFTVSQYQELEHQALIFKYMTAGLPVPADLLIPIQKSFESISHRFFHHPTVNYYSFYGKKVDPEPGRCRRTDGKKWRCSKDAYPDSKYCERHMHRGRNRSRKPVESQTMTHSSSSSATPAPATGPSAFQNLPFDVLPNSQSTLSRASNSRYQLDSIPFGIPSKDYGYPQGLKSEVGEQSFFTPASGTYRALQMDAQPDNIWPSSVSSIAGAKPSHDNMIQNEYSGHSLRPFFDEWPRARDSWSGLDGERSNQASFSTTHLSISIPMASPDFSASSSRSPHDN